MTIEITAQDRQALRAALRRKPRKIHELRALLHTRTLRRAGPEPAGRYFDEARVRWRRSIEQYSDNAIARLLGEWRRQGLVDNPVRGTWQWVGK